MSPTPARLSRRSFNAGLALALAAGAVGPARLLRPARAQFADEFTMAEIRPAVHAIIGRGGNSIVAVGDGGSLLVDTKTLGNGEPLREFAGSVGVPVAAVLNTHHHGDHTGGNPAFTPDLPVYAHAAATPRVRAQIASQGENPAPFLPTESVEEGSRLDIAGLRAELRHFGPGHTDNDIALFLPGKNVLHTGDLVFHGLHPFVDRPAGAITAGWIDACRAMLELCDAQTVVVPGHGDVSDRSCLEKQIAYFQAVRAAVGELVAADAPRVALDRIRLPVFEGLGFERLRTRVLEAVYEELTGAPAAG